MLRVVIGRFQPFHNRHKDLIDYATMNSKKTLVNDEVLIIVGSAFKSRSPRNPFTFEERKEVIKKIYPSAHIEPCEDYIDDLVWGKNIVEITRKYAVDGDVYIYGYPKDIKFNKKFLTGVSYNYKGYDSKVRVSGTEIRRTLYARYSSNAYGHLVPNETVNFLEKFDRNILKHLADVKVKNRFTQGVYVTVDNIVTWRQHIALIQRKDNGLYALPGGYLDKDERTETGALRELEEETGLKENQLFYKGKFAVDEVHRSGFGRLITFVYIWYCDPRKETPNIVGADDAKEASWNDLNVIDCFKEKFHDDHYQIIKGGIV